MTWVTVQTNDIGDTFLGIYALERSFGVGGAGAICLRLQGKEGVIGVVVSSFWDQSEERLQMAQAVSEGGSQGLGGCFAWARYCAKAHRSFWRERLRRARKARPSWGPKKLRWRLQKWWLRLGITASIARHP